MYGSVCCKAVFPLVWPKFGMVTHVTDRRVCKGSGVLNQQLHSSERKRLLMCAISQLYCWFCWLQDFENQSKLQSYGQEQSVCQATLWSHHLEMASTAVSNHVLQSSTWVLSVVSDMLTCKCWCAVEKGHQEVFQMLTCKNGLVSTLLLPFFVKMHSNSISVACIANVHRVSRNPGPLWFSGIISSKLL